MKWESFPITLTPLTPLHIGDGAQLEAYEYVVAKGRFYRLSLDRLLLRLSPAEQESLNRYIERDLVALRGFAREHFSPEVAEYEAEASPRFEKVYEEKLGQAQNQLIVYPFLRSLGKPLIPGSSLKGALRTAILDHLIASPITGDVHADTLEADTLGYMGKRRPDVPRDPLKGLRLTDISLREDQIIVEPVEIWEREDGRLADVSIQILREVTASTLTGQEFSLSGEIRIYEDFLNRQTASLKEGLPRLGKACNAFYRDRVLVEEERYFRGVKEVEDVYRSIRAEIAPNAFLIRLGWGSGVNSVSLNLRKRQPRPAKTRKLIDGRFPLGWMRVEFERAG
ncbi:MAG: type III-A CRISPR-associated RAMP protein Csm5 [Candidatus Binatia bacterium]